MGLETHIAHLHELLTIQFDPVFPDWFNRHHVSFVLSRLDE